jgi:branched-chain amino acid transport system substrate-binding protein
MTDEKVPFDSRISRRQLIERAGLGAGGLMLAQFGVACSTGSDSESSGNQAGSTAATAEGESYKIGFVSPITGPAAGFGETDPYVIDLAQKKFAEGFDVGGKSFAVQIVAKDGQSNPQRAAEVANDLIQSDKVDLMLATSTPECVNPVSDACEAAGVPCISSVVPWEAWYFGRGAKPGEPSPFRFTYHFCFGVENFAHTYLSLWKQIPTNKKVGVMWPNDADGNAIRENLGPLLEKGGYTIVDPGPYADGTNDYSSQIATFKRENCEIFNTFPIPPDFVTFWRQADAQGYTKMVKIAQIAKTGLFPSQVEAVGKLGPNLATGAYWAPTWPYPSSLTGVSSQDLGDGYTDATGKQWTQQLGASMALFDVAAAVMKASGDPTDKQKVADSMKTLSVDTPLGKLEWGKGPVDNVVETPIPGAQWVTSKSGDFPLDLVQCENADDPNIPVAAKLVPYNA